MCRPPSGKLKTSVQSDASSVSSLSSVASSASTVHSQTARRTLNQPPAGPSGNKRNISESTFSGRRLAFQSPKNTGKPPIGASPSHRSRKLPSIKTPPQARAKVKALHIAIARDIGKKWASASSQTKIVSRQKYSQFIKRHTKKSESESTSTSEDDTDTGSDTN